MVLDLSHGRLVQKILLGALLVVRSHAIGLRYAVQNPRQKLVNKLGLGPPVGARQPHPTYWLVRHWWRRALRRQWHASLPQFTLQGHGFPLSPLQFIKVFFLMHEVSH